MASTSGCSVLLKELEPSIAMGVGTSEANGTGMSSSSSCVERDSIVVVEESKEVSIEEEIERSKVHWSILAESGGEKAEALRPRRKWKKLLLCCSNVDDEEVAKVSNVKEFLALQSNPTWGDFFQTFGYDLGERYKRKGELVMGKKFAEGGQVELYDCKLKCWYSKWNDEDVVVGREYVLKVFKNGTYLKELKTQMPRGLLLVHLKDMERLKSSIVSPRFRSLVHRGTLLKDGRFAFLMEKEHFDLHHLIDRKMKLRSGEDCGPFSKEEVGYIMFGVALGVDWLHRQDIVHRDLKAANVLVWEVESGWPKWRISVADYECSVGVVGTGFFRAPEILQACKDHKVEERPEVFSKAADIYGYGMICYEILTRKLPFEGHPPYDYDHVLSGPPPLVPEHVEDWIHDLLDGCWQSNPATRPCIGDILSVILAHLEEAKRPEAHLVEGFGVDYRVGYEA